MNRGQFYRLLLSTSANPTDVVAAAKEMSLHLAAQTEESSTKDTTGDALEYEVVGQSYDITGSALVLTDNDSLVSDAQVLDDFIDNLNNSTLYWRICLMDGTANRSIVQEICSGTAKLTQLEMDGPNRQNASFRYTLKGQGVIVVSSASAQSAPSNSPAPEVADPVTLDPEDEGNDEG